MAGMSVAWGCGTADWEQEMAESRRPGMPGEKTVAAWRESGGPSARTDEAVRAQGAELAKNVLAVSGGALADEVEWKTAYASDVERVEVAEFRDGDGRTNRFAVYEQIGNQIPYYWTVEGGDASAVVASAKSVWEVEGVLERADVEMAERGVEVLPPYEHFRFRFLDDAPGLDWVRPCRYLFEDADGSGFTVLWKRLPPRMRYRSGGEEIHWVGETVREVPSERGNDDERRVE